MPPHGSARSGDAEIARRAPGGTRRIGIGGGIVRCGRGEGHDGSDDAPGPEGRLDAQAAQLAADQHGGVTEPGQHPLHDDRVVRPRPLGVDPPAQHRDEVDPLSRLQHAVGGVGRLADVVQDELVGTLDHAGHPLSTSPRS